MAFEGTPYKAQDIYRLRRLYRTRLFALRQNYGLAEFLCLFYKVCDFHAAQCKIFCRGQYVLRRQFNYHIDAVFDRPRIKALNELNSKVLPHTVKRIGGGYHDKKATELCSASAVREACEKGKLNDVRQSVPACVYDALSRSDMQKHLDVKDRIFMLLKYCAPKEGRNTASRLCE